jgi:hypothetical protein
MVQALHVMRGMWGLREREGDVEQEAANPSILHHLASRFQREIGRRVTLPEMDRGPV